MLLHAAVNKAVAAANALQKDQLRSLVEEGDEVEGQQVVPVKEIESDIVLDEENQPEKQPTNQPEKRPAKQPVKQVESQPKNQPAKQPKNQPAKQGIVPRAAHLLIRLNFMTIGLNFQREKTGCQAAPRPGKLV